MPVPSGLQFLLKKSADNHAGIPLYVICCFSLVALNIFSLSLIFVSLICVLACSSLTLSCMGLSALLERLGRLLFPMLEKFSDIISSNIFLGHISFFPFWDTYNANVGAFNVISEVS